MDITGSDIDAELARRGAEKLAPAGPALSTADLNGELFRRGIDPVKAQAAAPEPDMSRRSPTFDPVTNAVVQGATFGLSDEAAGAGAAVGRALRNRGEPGALNWLLRGLVPGMAEKPTGNEPTPGQAYDAQLGTERKAAHDFAESSPFISGGLEFAGGLATGAPIRAFAGSLGAQAPGVLPYVASLGKGAAAAGAYGAAAGFGGGEGGLENRLGSAAVGGALSAGLGAALPFAANAASSVAGKVANVFGLRNADSAAMNQILRAFERDGVTPQDAMTRLQGWVSDGAKPAMLFDLGGENVRGLARSAAGVPGAAKNLAVEALQGRQAGQSERVAGDIASTLSPNNDFHGSLDALRQQRSAAAAPLYERAYAQEGVWTPRLQEFIDDPIMQDGLKRGMNMLRLEAVAKGEQFNPHTLGVDYSPDPNAAVKFISAPNMRVLDAGKRGLDDILEKYRSDVTGKLNLTPEGRAINDFRAAYVRKLDSLNGDYAQARAAYSGPTQSMDAMAMGRNIFNRDSEITTKMVADLKPGDKEFFKAGVVRAMKDMMDNAPDGADAVKRVFSKPAQRAKLEAAFDNPTDFMRFQSLMNRELELYRNAQSVSPKAGSQTQLRAAENQDMANDPAIGILGSIASGGSLWGSAMNVGKDLYRRGQGINPATADALAQRMFNPGNLQQTLGALNSGDLRNRYLFNRNLDATRGLLGGLGAGTGLLADTR